MPFRILGMVGLFRLLGKKMIYDIDDAVYLNTDTSLPKILSFIEDRQQIQKLIKCADVVLAGNRHLKEYAGKLNDKIVVLPTAVDTDVFRKSVTGRPDKSIIIGWIGSESTNRYVNILIPVLNRLKGHYEMEFWICSSSLKNIEMQNISFPFKFVKWSTVNERYFLCSIDIGVMPLEDSGWERCKCGFKIIQYMAYNVPVVASPVGVNKEIIKDGENGFLASDENEWIKKINILFSDKELRRQFSVKGRDTVEKEYSVKLNFPLFLKVINEGIL